MKRNPGQITTKIVNTTKVVAKTVKLGIFFKNLNIIKVIGRGEYSRPGICQPDCIKLFLFPKLLKALAQGLLGDAKDFGCSRLIAACLFHGFFHQGVGGFF